MTDQQIPADMTDEELAASVTPDEARAMLTGTTPGPWEWADCDDEGGGVHMALRNPAGDKAVITEDAESFQSGVRGTPADLNLTAAAPVLAAMIAGMHEEWGVRYESPFGGLVAHHEQWMDSENRPLDRYAARRFADGCERSGYENVRIVRRYVTTPKEIE